MQQRNEGLAPFQVSFTPHQFTPKYFYDLYSFSDEEIGKNPLSSHSCNLHYPKIMIHWKCRMILSKKVNTNCMKLNNGYQSSLSSLSTSLNIYFFILVSKAALVDWLWLKLLTSTLINGYPKSSMDISSMLSDIILPETTNVLWVYTLSMYYGERSTVMWNRKLCWRWTCLPSAMPEIEVFRLQPSEKILWRRLSGGFHKEAFFCPQGWSPTSFRVPAQV